MSNVLTDAGCQYIATLLSANLALTPDFITWGTGTAAATDADTALGHEEIEDRSLAQRANPALDTAQWTGNLVALGPKTITEAAVYSAPFGGLMMLKASFPGVVLATGAAIQFIFTLRITQ